MVVIYYITTEGTWCKSGSISTSKLDIALIIILYSLIQIGTGVQESLLSALIDSMQWRKLRLCFYIEQHS